MMEVGQYFTYKFVSVQNSFTWYLTGLYAPHTRGEKLECWEEIAAIKELCEGPWISHGDFNTVRFMKERRGCNRITNVMSEFSK
uniref:Putative ovule protein n=1 Tax=Solanum chacoense TaxID=4108 RepID=A0A0V0H1E2_SOLCH